ncbi:MAG: porin [Ignavibacteria bacterium]|nr:porin [Ignavibacteria bacterium]
MKSVCTIAITLYSVLGSFLFSATCAFAQNGTQNGGGVDFGPKGIIFQSADSLNKVVLRFRMQNWVTYVSKSETDLSAQSIDFLVRRLRLNISGQLVDPRLTYKIELFFSKADQDFITPQAPNIIGDAMVYWSFSQNLQVGFGQTKLPGNRQRVISSGDMEFPDRSIVNGAFNIDRDFGFQGFWRPINGDVIVNLMAALTDGRGRNQAPSLGGGLAYTGRIELLPFGAFKNRGDYFEGDLEHEQSPKLSIGLSGQLNENMRRTRGELGTELYSKTEATTIYADAVMKWNGLALYGEYASRTSPAPLTYLPTDSTKIQAVLVGMGYMGQATYTFLSGIALGGRYAYVKTSDDLAGRPEYGTDQSISGVVAYYIKNHRIKTQLEMGLNSRTNFNSNLETSNYFGRYSVEFGI